MTRLPLKSALSWWVAIPVLAIGAFAAWVILFYTPHDLASLGRQMVAVSAIAISLAPVLLIPSEEAQQP